MPFQAVSVEEHQQALERIDQLERDFKLIKSLLLNETWLTRTQTMHALGISKTTLWKLTKAGAFTYRRIGRKLNYSVDSVRQHLAGQKIQAWNIDHLILAASRMA